MQKKILYYILILFLFIPLRGFGQELKIDVELKQSAGQELFLAQYYLGNIYAKDTILLDKEGRGSFIADVAMPQGLYKLFLNENTHFDFLMGNDQQFTLKSSNLETIHVSGAEETESFIEYTGYLKNLQKKNAEIRKQMETAGVEEKEKLTEEMARLTEQLHDYWDKLEKEFPESFLPKFVRATHVPVPDVALLPYEVQQNDSLLLMTRFYFQQKHFWDNFDYTDERFLYTPFFRNKLETWFTKVLYQHYDSVKHHIFDFLEEVKPNKRIFQFATSFFLNSSINSNIMGMDALFVDLARKYYLSGEAFWATDESLQKIRENVRFFENNLIGKTAPDLTLEGFDGQYYNLNQVNARYTIVLIYEPGCSHCKEFVPQLYSRVYVPFRNKGLEVFAIYSMSDRHEWEEFLAEHHLHDWMNVWDEHHASRFKILYDARTTPNIFLLDAQKKIIAKKMTVDQVKYLLEKELL